jgi:hypothetical protein
MMNVAREIWHGWKRLATVQSAKGRYQVRQSYCITLSVVEFDENPDDIFASKNEEPKEWTTELE